MSRLIQMPKEIKDINKLNKLDFPQDTLDIVNQLIKNEFVYIDNHNNEERNIFGIAFLEDGTPCTIMDSVYFSMNPLRLNEKSGRVHLSTWSCGGSVTGYDKNFTVYNDSMMIDRLKVRAYWYKEGKNERKGY